MTTEPWRRVASVLVNDTLRIAIIAVVAVIVAKFVLPKIPVVGSAVGGYL